MDACDGGDSVFVESDKMAKEPWEKLEMGRGLTRLRQNKHQPYAALGKVGVPPGLVLRLRAMGSDQDQGVGRHVDYFVPTPVTKEHQEK